MSQHMLFFLLSLLVNQAISSACFTESPWKNVRSLVGMIDSCSTTADCENECLANSQCDAYVFSTRCALFGIDSGKPQCVQSGMTFWQRLPACGGAQPSTTITSATTTTTKATSECLNFSHYDNCWFYDIDDRGGRNDDYCEVDHHRNNDNDEANDPCGVLVYQQPASCAGGCPSPTMGMMETKCATRYTLYVDGNGQGNLTCVGTDWTYVYMGSPYTFAPGSTVYCVNTMG